MMPNVTRMRVKFVQTTGYELTIIVVLVSPRFASLLFVRLQSFSQDRR